MTPYLLAAILVGGAAAWEDGSLVVIQNSNKPVSSYTGSTITHVAMIRNMAGNPWVYEATPAKVRRVPLSTYAAEIAEINTLRAKPTRMWVMEPKRAYTSGELAHMNAYLDSQLGRRYSVKGYVRGRRGDGIHCAEFASTALSVTGRYRFAESQKISPSQMVRLIKQSHHQPRLLPLQRRLPDESWCTRMWHKFTSVRVWCAWACYEAWMFCR